MDIKIKPHHLLDIFKLYGKGVESFIPDERYNHNFYCIANAVVNLSIINVKFTIGADDICGPCKFLKDDKCSDTFTYNEAVYNKNEYNTILDERLMKFLNFEEDKEYRFNEKISYINSTLSKKIIEDTWDNNTIQENVLRYKYTMCGIEIYINKLKK